jgi:hypothetical protein
MWPHQRIKNNSCRLKQEEHFAILLYRVLKFCQIIQPRSGTFVDCTNMHYLTSPTCFGLVGLLQGFHSIQPEDPEDYYIFLLQ